MLKPDIVKRGDNATLTYRANADLTEATLMTWLARHSPDGPVLMSKTATLTSVDGATSVITVELTPAETAAKGIWLVEVEVTIGGKTRTFPSTGYLRLEVIDDLS